MISLVMFSGGIDSTYALYKVLCETDDEVLVHHIHLITDLGRHVVEDAACKNIVAYCRKNVRPFYYTESSIDHRRFMAHGYDLAAAGFEAGMVAASFRLASGKTANIDRWIVGISADDVVPPERFENAQRCCVANCSGGTPPNLFIFPRVDVKDQIRSLPKELFDMTWSCRQPRGLPNRVQPCGRCKSCERRNLAAMALQENPVGSEQRVGPVPVE